MTSPAFHSGMSLWYADYNCNENISKLHLAGTLRNCQFTEHDMFSSKHLWFNELSSNGSQGLRGNVFRFLVDCLPTKDTVLPGLLVLMQACQLDCIRPGDPQGSWFLTLANCLSGRDVVLLGFLRQSTWKSILRTPEAR